MAFKNIIYGMVVAAVAFLSERDGISHKQNKKGFFLVGMFLF